METPTPTTPVTEDTTERVPFWKQLMGAAVGGSLALGLYYGYETVEPQVQALLTLPSGERVFDLGAANIADKTTDEGDRKRILSRTVRNAQMLDANNDVATLDTVDTHELDVAWAGHNVNDPKYTEVTGIEVAMEEEPEMMMEEESMDMDTQDDWDMLWEDIKEREYVSGPIEVEESNAEDLPDTGLGLGVAIAGALGGTLGMRRKRNQVTSDK